MEHAPLIDITSLNSVESVFGSVADFDAKRITSDFIDLFVWHDTIRYLNVTTGDAGPIEGERYHSLPSLLHALQRRDSPAFVEEAHHFEERIEIDRSHLSEAVSSFASYALNNPKRLQRLIEVHRAPWIQDQRTRIGTRIHLSS
jgi:hypothetical protein